MKYDTQLPSVDPQEYDLELEDFRREFRERKKGRIEFSWSYLYIGMHGV